MLFSIIVPVYKVDYTKLKNCINSLISQTYSNIEIILVDDGSPDECPKICDEYANKYNFVKVIHQKNKGLSGARNSGVRNCTGDYYTFVDGDDYLTKDAISTFSQYINCNKCDVFCSRLIPASKTEDIGSYPYVFNKVYSDEKEKEYLKAMLLNFNGNNNSACGKMYKKSFTDKLEIYHDEDLKQGAEDLEFNFRVFSHASEIMFISEKVYQCVYSCDSITRSFSIENEYLILECFKKIKGYINDEDKCIIDNFNNRLIYVIVNTAISGFFNPTNKSSYFIQKKQYLEFISDDLFNIAINYRSELKIDKIRRIILFFIKRKILLPVKILSIIRFYQKKRKRL